MSDLLDPTPHAPGAGTVDRGALAGLPAPLRHLLSEDCPATPLSAEQSNSSVTARRPGHLKFIRRFEEGVNPGVEIGRFLSERGRFAHAPERREHRVPGRHARIEAPATVVVLEE